MHFYVINNGFKTEYFYEKGKPLRYDDDEDVEWRISEDWLNCEVEIIEEDKKIEKIPYQFNLNYIDSKLDSYTKEEINNTINHIYDKINEIIDKLNEGE